MSDVTCNEHTWYDGDIDSHTAVDVDLVVMSC